MRRYTTKEQDFLCHQHGADEDPDEDDDEALVSVLVERGAKARRAARACV